MRHIISLKEQSADDIRTIIDLALRIKEMYCAGEPTHILEDKTLLMFFQKGSTRTRISFEAAMTELGGHAIFLDAMKTQFLFAEFRDEVRAMMRLGHILMMRALRAEDVALAALFNIVPVIDGCSEKYHPCQSLGDLLTMAEHSGGIDKINKVAWVGGENNVSNTLKIICARLGIEFAIASPEIDREGVDDELNALAKKSGKVSHVENAAEA